jgi:hypothetical protein
MNSGLHGRDSTGILKLYNGKEHNTMKKSEVKALINSKKFVQSVFIRPINGIDYLVIDGSAHAVSSWQQVADKINTLDVVPEVFKGGELTDQELAAK